jgi:hypothetical protein
MICTERHQHSILLACKCYTWRQHETWIPVNIHIYIKVPKRSGQGPSCTGVFSLADILEILSNSLFFLTSLAHVLFFPSAHGAKWLQVSHLCASWAHPIQKKGDHHHSRSYRLPWQWDTITILRVIHTMTFQNSLLTTLLSEAFVTGLLPN